MFVNELFGDEHVEKIESTLKSAGYTELGSGADASVWGKDEGSVIKILMPESGELATAEKIFLAYYKTAQKYRDNPHLVKFIDIGGKHFTKFNIDGETFYQIAVEKLKPLKSRSFEEAMVWAMSDLVSNNFSWADAYRQISNPNSTIWKFADNDEINKTKVIKTIASLDQSKLLQLQYLYLTMQLVYQIGRRQGFGWDLHTENAMQRSDGTIVITDPWYSDVLSESFVLGVAESQTAKTGIMQTDVYGSRAYHAKCLEPGCDWESRRYDRIQQAQAAAKKHAATHFDKKAVAEGVLNFEAGHCPIFAIALHRLSKLPLMALIEYDEELESTVLIHAYVKLDEMWRIDATGKTTVDHIEDSYPNYGDTEEVEISEKDLLELGYGKNKCPTLQQVLPYAKKVLQNIEVDKQGLTEGVENNDTAISLSRLGRFHKGQDTLAEFVPERATARYALHPDKWESTFFSLTNKDPRKLKYFGPKKIVIPPGTLVGDMAIANRFYRAETEEEKQKYAEEYRQSLKPYPVDFSQYRMPELLIPREGVAEGLEQKMSVKDTLAYLQKVMGTASHEDWRNHIVNTNEYFVLKQVPVSSLKSNLSGLNKDNVEKYKQMDFSKAPPIVIGSNGNILDGYHRVNVAKALRVPTLKAWVGVKKQGVAEAFDQPYKLKWEKSDYGDVDALATLQDGTSLSIMFNLADKLENNWGVEFYRNNSQAATGEGDAQRVFATVLAAIGQFIKKKKPNTLFFTAVKEEDPTGSRAKLYDRLVQRYATGLGYDLKKVDYPEQTGYKLTRQEQGVTEDFGQLDELVNKQLFRQGFEDTRSYGEYTLVAKPGYMPYIPGKNSVISNFFRIEAYKGRVMVGWVNFEDKDGDLEALDLQVDQKHRRKGIATAMYDFAKDLGNTIKPSTKQTAMGKKFWAGAKDRDR